MGEFHTERAKRTLLFSLVSVGMGFTVLFPILAPLGREMGLSEIQITTIIGSSGLVVFLTSPIWGRRSDAWGRKRVLLCGLFGFSAGTFLFNSVLYLGLAGILTGSLLFIALVIARVTHASVMSASMPAANAYMADITDAASRTRGMAAAGAANNIGTILGPAVAGLAVISLLTPLWVMAAIAFLNGLFVWRFLEEPPKHQTPVVRDRLKYSDPRILPFIIIGIAMFTGMGLVQQTMGFRFQDALGLSAAETAQNFGFAMMLSGASSLFSQAVIVQRFNLAPFTLLRFAIPLLIVAFTMMALLETQLWLTIAMMVQGLGMGLASPGFTAGASLAVSPEEQGAVAGVAGSCGPLGFTLGPFIGGALYTLSPTAPYFFAAGLFLILFLFMNQLGKRVRSHAT
ncbi:MAG: MFS transporter [Pseudomonadales bacterium]|jgi:MFS family permease|nr:MFS transporter [Pseudomonadales bacterium]MDA7833852.1 MFS transporter [Pseudomonadales bacterium]MDA8879517.1 MFS transporter [Pseudomonadales bacterium]MDC0892627.1 MFS transporter [Pseudomonadales bacterium]MDC0995900.1 MFS transporter [Pseudomonadales bacterium]|tara:strand:+ start:1661 stop:2860 length:1200 start_codon:yes stop_codon:yes gene_type:complete